MTGISSNLQEIYSACRKSSKPETSLVPSLLTKRVYYSGAGWGRLWKWFYQAVQFLFGKDLKTDRLTKVMQKTQAVFNQKLPAILEHTTSYQTYLDKRIGGEEVDEEEIHTSRKQITSWTRSTAPFTAFVDKSNNQKITPLFQTFFSDEVEKGEPLFSYGNQANSLQETQLLIDLEGYLHCPLPIELLMKLAREENLSTEDAHLLENWIDLLNKKQNHIPIGLFLDCLKVLTDKPGFGGSLISLEMQLLKNDLKILQITEPEHLAWRSSLKAGDILELEATTYTLGEQIETQNEGFDSNIHFEIEGDQERVISIGINRAFWKMRERIALDHQWGIPMPAVHEISPDGRFAVVEKLSSAVEKEQWITPENHPVEAQDQLTLIPIANLFQWWGDRSICPSNFTLDHLMFNKSGELKYTHALMPQPFDFQILEDLAYEIAQDKLVIYLFLFEHSGLKSHITMRFYQRIVGKALKDKKVNTKSLAACYKVTDPEVIKRGKALYKEIRVMRDIILKTLNREYQVADQEKLLQNANSQLLEWYIGTCSASRIWPTIETLVTQNLRRFLNISKCPMTAGDLVSTV